MENQLPVPTDNIFKFYALFGLLLFVFSAGSLIYVNNSINDTILTNIVEIEALKSVEKPTSAETVKRDVLKRKIDVAVSDRKTFLYALGALFFAALCAMCYGFRKWHTEVQPSADEISRVQLEIAKLQLEKLRRDLDGDA